MRQVIARLGRFAVFRAIWLFLAVVVAIYLTVIIANMGGALDTIRKAEIRNAVAMSIYMNPANKGLPASVLQQMVDETAELEYRRLGLDQPFFPKRSFNYLWHALSLQLGRAEQLTSDAGSKQVRLIILERLPSTLILFGTAELLLFVSSLFIALVLSRRYGSFLDRLTIGLAPSSAAPGWFYGIFLLLIFAAVLRVLPWGGMVRTPPPADTWVYALSMLRHMILPLTAIIIGAIFASIYAWRTFFLIYSSEDYVELAKAKGLSSQAIERRYVLRPTLPVIITDFLLLVITMWMGQIVLEYVFKWPGLGQIFYQATQASDTPVIVGVIVIYGYLLAASVYILDFVYAIVDPRVRVGPAGTGR
jgi:peptide/nickel transport system permease protein